MNFPDAAQCIWALAEKGLLKEGEMYDVDFGVVADLRFNNKFIWTKIDIRTINGGCRHRNSW